MSRSKHQLKVNWFMEKAGQEVPVKPKEPSEKVRILRAKLIFEEAMETICDGLGVEIRTKGGDSIAQIIEELEYEVEALFDMVETVDGCCDIKVVTTGTLSACGIPDEEVQKLVDDNNLAKFGPGHKIREDGKLLKPEGHKPPDIKGYLEKLNG